MDNFFEQISRQERVCFGELSGQAAVETSAISFEFPNEPDDIGPADDEGFTGRLHPVFQTGGGAFRESAGFQQAFQNPQDGRFQGMEVDFADDDVSAGFDHSGDFGNRFFNFRDVHQHAVKQGSVEGIIVKGEAEQIALFYGDRVLQSQPAHILSYVFEDDGRKIDTGHLEAASGQADGVEA